WEDRWLIGDQSNDDNRIAVTMDPGTVNKQGPPAFAEDLRHIIPSGTGNKQLMSWMDAKFGEDGALYMLDYGGGFFSLDDRQKLIRISYHGGPPTPAPGSSGLTAGAPAAGQRSVDAEPTSQGTPTRIKFAGQQAGGVAWEWDFGDGTTSKAMSPVHTFTKGGSFDVTLEVTYADGETATVEQQVDVSCPAPDSRPTVRFLDRDTGVDNESVGGGCTVNDVIDDESQWGSHPQFVSYVERVTERMAEDGPLSDTQAYGLQRSAAASQVGNTNAYQPIFDGTPASLKGWEQAPSGEFTRTKQGNLRSSGGLGMLWYAKRSYGDFSLRLQFRDMAPEGHRANSGVFVRFPDIRTPVEDRPKGSCGTVGSAKDTPAWVAIYCGQEIQIFDGPQSDEGEQQKTGSVYNFDPVAIDDAEPTEKKVWNDYEIRVVDQKYTIIRNGVVINRFTNAPGKESSRDGDPPTDLRQFASGYIGLQNHSDDDRIEFRNIRVQRR
ncbi:MAG TPA: family 16 glycoside hydrolase, partial [Nocardioidaceae bacterium]|nr:family 16 glycoside hydrolase [Nocardioidaceae bacterium]